MKRRRPAVFSEESSEFPIPKLQNDSPTLWDKIMKHLFLVLAALSGFVACERQAWDETRKLHLHEAHDDGHKGGTAHADGGSREEGSTSEGREDSR